MRELYRDAVRGVHKEELAGIIGQGAGKSNLATRADRAVKPEGFRRRDVPGLEPLCGAAVHGLQPKRGRDCVIAGHEQVFSIGHPDRADDTGLASSSWLYRELVWVLSAPGPPLTEVRFTSDSFQLLPSRFRR